MCTLIVANRLFERVALLVAANRDERLGRPAGPPALRQPAAPGGPAILAPRDLQAGGTWLGVNAAGVFAAVVNRAEVPHEPGRRSRGLLVLDALGQRSAHQGAAQAAAWEASAHNGFCLLVADATQAWLVAGDGREQVQVQRLEPGWHVVTERSRDAGAPQARQRLLAERLSPLAARGPDEAVRSLRALLAEHGAGGLDGVCVHAPGLDYGTRSASVLRLGSGRTAAPPCWWHAEGPPCCTRWRDLSPLLVRLLGEQPARAQGPRQA
ncbi:MAG: hypothetical protein KatS3mg102_2390 [Planctomycetota bacterium]|nr:MAG: hypothetical protein KatS3mg102_2390 [Planctomycetota bacterium]